MPNHRPDQSADEVADTRADNPRPDHARAHHALLIIVIAVAVAARLKGSGEDEADADGAAGGGFENPMYDFQPQPHTDTGFMDVASFASAGYMDVTPAGSFASTGYMDVTPAGSSKLEKKAARILTKKLGRKPTPAEIAKKGPAA